LGNAEGEVNRRSFVGGGDDRGVIIYLPSDR
jgi:hypothetical protein